MYYEAWTESGHEWARERFKTENNSYAWLLALLLPQNEQAKRHGKVQLYLVLTTNIPHSKANVLVLHSLNIKSWKKNDKYNTISHERI